MNTINQARVSPQVESEFSTKLWNLELGRILLVQEYNLAESDELLDPTPMELEIGDEELSLSYANECLNDFYSNWEILGNPGNFQITQGTYAKLLLKMGSRDPWMTVIKKKDAKSGVKPQKGY